MDPEVLTQLQHSRLFKNADLKKLEADFSSCKILILPKDAVLLQPGVMNTTVYFVISGEFIVTYDLLAIDVVANLHPSDCIGEVSFLDHNPPTTYVIAATLSKVLVCPEALMWQMLKRETDFPFNMLELLVERFREKNELLKNGLSRVRHFQVRSEIDTLTGIYNRNWCDEVFPRQIDLCERLDQPVALAMLDLDRFKQVNDRYGHPAGDAVLRRAATLIRDQLRVTDLTARYGGEEFIVMLPATSAHEAMEKLNAVREQIQNTPFELPDGRSIQCTVSIGVAAWREGLDLHALVSLADEALYQAKHQGRNQVVLAQKAQTQRPSLNASKR